MMIEKSHWLSKLLCKWSGAGCMYCTVEVRKRHPYLCGSCPKNPDTIVQEIASKQNKDIRRLISD